MSGPFVAKRGSTSFMQTFSPSRTFSPISRISFLIVFPLALAVSSHASKKIRIDPAAGNGQSPLPVSIEEAILSTLIKRALPQMK
jgi:hypothetical protein